MRTDAADPIPADALAGLKAIKAALDPYLKDPDTVMLIRSWLPTTGDKPAEPAKVEPIVDADPAMAKELEAVRADALAQKARADAAQTKLDAIDQAARTTRYGALKVRADALDLKPAAIEKPTDAQIGALALQIAEHGLRADAASDPYARPTEAPSDRPAHPNAIKAPPLPLGAFGGGRS